MLAGGLVLLLLVGWLATPRQRFYRLVELGDQALLSRDFAQAGARYEEASRLLPRDAIPYARLGLLLSLQGRAEEALALYRQALEHNPDNPEALVQGGELLMALGHLDEAQSWFSRALKGPASPLEICLLMARLERLRGRPEHEKRWLEQAVRLSAHYEEAHLGLARLAAEKGNWTENEAELQQSLGMSAAWDANVYTLLGRSLLAQGKRHDAMVAFSRAIRTSSQSADAFFALGDLQRSEDPAGARSLLEHFLRLEPTGPRADQARKWLESL